jgi:hypothetical protein
VSAEFTPLLVISELQMWIAIGAAALVTLAWGLDRH